MKRIFLLILTIFSLSNASAQCTMGGSLTPEAYNLSVFYNFDPSSTLPITVVTQNYGTLTLNSYSGNIYLANFLLGGNENFVFYDANGCYYEEWKFQYSSFLGYL